MVGRDVELAVLGECLTESLSGRPRVVVCWGEPGVGKTRLAEETLAMAAGRGALGVWGVADESSGAPPCWPWWQALRTVAETVDVGAIAAGCRLTGEVARLAPDVFASLGEGPQGRPLAEDRFRQFDAVARWLRRPCLQEPLVIVLDDAHWADLPSLLLLRHVARGLSDERLMIVVNSRDSIDDSRGELLTRLAREPFAREVQLHGLTGQGIRRQLEVAELLAEGLSNREIAARLFLSERTAQNHVQHILTKLRVSNRSQVAVWFATQR